MKVYRSHKVIIYQRTACVQLILCLTCGDGFTNLLLFLTYNNNDDDDDINKKIIHNNNCIFKHYTKSVSIISTFIKHFFP